jgi:uncharacterized protein YkwD
MRLLATTGLLVILAPPFANFARAQKVPSGPERILFDAANRERKAQGAPALRWDDSLAAAARQHSQVMAQHNAISHQFPGEDDFAQRASDAGANFSAVAENVAVGPDADTIHNAWMKSPGHRRNVLDPQLDSLGVAVVRNGSELFAVEDFARAVTTLSMTQQEDLVAAQLKSRGLRLSADREPARRACLQQKTSPVGRQSQLLLRYSTSDPGHLPAALDKTIHSGRYHVAVVGACRSAGERNAFTSYQLAVILLESVAEPLR